MLGHWGTSATESHHPWSQPFSYRKTSGLPLIVYCDELYNCLLIYHNVILIETKCTISVGLESSWNHPLPSPWKHYLPQNWPPVPKRLGTTDLQDRNQKLKVAAEKELGIGKEFNLWLSFLLLSVANPDSSRNLQGHTEPTDRMDTLCPTSSPNWVLHMISMILFLAIWNIIMVCKEPDL